MSEPLWSDERITKEARWFIDANYNKRVVAEQAMVKVRDEYETRIAELEKFNNEFLFGSMKMISGVDDKLKAAQARIAQLEAQLAETWQPVVDGEYTLGDAEQGYLHILDVLKGGDAIGVSDKEVLYYVDLGDLRLCCKAATVAAEPVVVVDWSQYGEEYRWFAVDDDGAGWIYMYPPEISQNYWRVNTGSDFEDMIGNFNATDWRATLTERPNQPPSGVTKA